MTMTLLKKPLSGKRELRSAETRAAILRAAAHIFAEEGLAGARTDAIAVAAGVNKALLYYYFKNKNALYFAVIEEHLKEFHQRAMEVLCAGQNVRATLLAYVSMHFDFLSARPYYPRLSQRFMMAAGPGLERLARKYFLPLREQLMRAIEQGVRSGELRNVNAAHTVVSLVGLTVFYFASPVIRLAGHADPYERKQLTQRKQEILKFVRYGLFKNPEESWE